MPGVTYEPIVKQDLRLGYGTVSVTMPAGGQAIGDKIGVHTFLPKVYNCLDFGAAGDGTSDDTAAIQATLDAARGEAANDGGGGVVWLPGGSTFVCRSALDLTDAFNLTVISAGARVLYTGSAANFIDLSSAQRVRFENIKLHYNHAGFSGTFIKTGHSSGLATDPAYIQFLNCEFAGVDGARGAAHLLDLDTAIISTVRTCKFVNADNALRLGGTNYSNIILIDDATFQDMTTSAATMAACQSVTFRSCTFERSVLGRSCGIHNTFGSFSYGTNFLGCWFGDVSSGGGGAWIQLRTLGGTIHGNFFGTPGSAAGDYCVDLAGSQGLSIQGNRFEGPTNINVRAGGNSFGVWLSANDFQGGTPINGQGNLSQSSGQANNGLLSFTV